MWSIPTHSVLLYLLASEVWPGVAALGSVNEALQAAGEGRAWERSWKSDFWRLSTDENPL